MDDLQSLQETIGYTFRDESLLGLALTHPSASGKKSNPSEDNQRMEFLGDAVLQAVISDALYSLHPNHDEGTLTKARAALSSSCRSVGQPSGRATTRGAAPRSPVSTASAAKAGCPAAL